MAGISHNFLLPACLDLSLLRYLFSAPFPVLQRRITPLLPTHHTMRFFCAAAAVGHRSGLNSSVSCTGSVSSPEQCGSDARRIYRQANKALKPHLGPWRTSGVTWNNLRLHRFIEQGSRQENVMVPYRYSRAHIHIYLALMVGDRKGRTDDCGLLNFPGGDNNACAPSTYLITISLFYSLSHGCSPSLLLPALNTNTCFLCLLPARPTFSLYHYLSYTTHHLSSYLYAHAACLRVLFYHSSCICSGLWCFFSLP